MPWKDWILYYALSVLIVVVAYLAAYRVLLPACQRSSGGCAPDEVFRVSSDFSAMAALFVLALAIERFLEPVSRFIGKDTEKAKDERDKAQAAAETEATADNAQALARKQAEVDRARQIGMIMHWGVASGISFLIAAKLNVLLLAAIAAEGGARPSPWADLLVTGLVVGAGTKPVHDLVSRLEKSKEKTQDPAATGGSA